MRIHERDQIIQNMYNSLFHGYFKQLIEIYSNYIKIYSFLQCVELRLTALIQTFFL